MTNPRATFRLLARTATVLAFLVVVFGAFVRLSDAGLGCPDWPGCYGHVSVPDSGAKLAKALEKFPGAVVEGRKAWIEMIHRYLAGSLGLLVLAIAVIALRRRPALGRSPALPVALVGLIIIQALFGMWTVTLRLMPLVVTAHLLGGMTTLALLSWLTARQNPVEAGRSGAGQSALGARRWARIALAVLFVQIALGGWVSTNYAGMACTDVPLCHGSILPAMDVNAGFSLWRELGMTAQGTPLPIEALTAIQWAHRAGAVAAVVVIVVAGLLSLPVPATRRLGQAVLALALAQAGLGIANVAFVLPVPLAVAHNAGAALLLAALVMLNFGVNSASGREI
jgi:cytochrome c oxidase assembly protein subunit 15